MKIYATHRLRAGLQDQIELIKKRLGVDGYCIQHSNQSIMFQFYVHPPVEYLEKLKKEFGPPKVGKANGETIYRWNLKSIGLNFYLPDDYKKAARIQMYNRDEQYASAIVAYDNTWIKKEELHREAHPKYQGQQKPTQLDDHIFNMQPGPLSQNLKTVYKDDYDGAMGVLNLYKNRQGKNLKSPDRDRLDKAKTELRKKYGKDDARKAAPPGTKPHGKSKPADVGVDKPIGTEPIGSKPTTKTI